MDSTITNNLSVITTLCLHKKIHILDLNTYIYNVGVK